MHSLKTCAHSFGQLNGLPSIDVVSAPPCEGRSLAKQTHLEHMSPGVWTESDAAGSHNEVLSSLSKVSSWFKLTGYGRKKEKKKKTPGWLNSSYTAALCWCLYINCLMGKSWSWQLIWTGWCPQSKQTTPVSWSEQWSYTNHLYEQCLWQLPIRVETGTGPRTRCLSEQNKTASQFASPGHSWNVDHRATSDIFKTPVY